MIKINLIRSAGSKQKKINRGENFVEDNKSAVVKIVVALLLLILAAATPFYLTTVEVYKLNVEIADLDKREKDFRKIIAKSKKILAEVEKIEKEIKRKEREFLAISSIKEERNRAFTLMDKISLLMPEELWLESIRFAQRNLEMGGVSSGFAPVNALISSLQKDENFSSVTLKSISSRGELTDSGGSDSKKGLKKFSIVVELRDSV